MENDRSYSGVLSPNIYIKGEINMNSKLLNIIVIGHHSRVSDLVMTEEQDIYLSEALNDLKEALDKMYEWDTIRIEIKKNVPDTGDVNE